MNIDNMMYLLLFITICITIVIIIFAPLMGQNSADKDCRNLGYDGAESQMLSRYKCYNEVIHSSGVGIERVYSGVIK